jgi:hypothetical protein
MPNTPHDDIDPLRKPWSEEYGEDLEVVAKVKRGWLRGPATIRIV